MAGVSKTWSGKRDSNSRPRPWQGRALPTELFPRELAMITPVRCQSRAAGSLSIGCIVTFHVLSSHRGNGEYAMIRIVLVDDHELVRAGFRLILSGQSDIEVIGEAGSTEDGLRLIRAQKPDVALIDVHMPGMSGIELTERVRRADLATHI